MALDKKELSRQLKDVRAAIKSGRSSIGGLFKEYGRAIAQLRNAERRHSAASAKYIKKTSESNKLARDSSFDLMQLALNEARGQRDRLIRYRDDILSAYQRLAELAVSGGAVRQREAEAERESFVRDFNNKMSSMEQGLLIERAVSVTDGADVSTPSYVPSDDDSTDKQAVALDIPGESEEEPVRPISAGSRTPAVGIASVNIAPISIDVSDIVKQAVGSVVDKLNETLKGKIEKAVRELEFPRQPDVLEPKRRDSASADFDAVTTELERVRGAISALVKDIENVGGLAASLSEQMEMMSQRMAQLDIRKPEPAVQDAEENAAIPVLEQEGEGLVRLGDESARRIAEITAALDTLAESQRSIALMQKETAELQKKTVRIQQGIRVGQKLLDENSAEVVFKKTEAKEEKN